MITKNELLQATHHGFYIYQRVLSYYYENPLLLGLSGKRCLPAQNPFNGNQVNLQISLEGEVFCYLDDLLPDFRGDAIDFAALHYKLQGDELLEKIRQELNLVVGEGEKMRKGEGKMEEGEGRVYLPPFVLDLPQFSYYRCPISNTRPEKSLNLLEVFNLVTGDAYKECTQTLRSISDPEAASQYKRINLDYVTFSGVFSKRSDAALVSHSGLMVLDFDHVDNIKLVKQALLNDPSSDLDIDMMFVSPSGHGLKCVMSIDVMRHPQQRWFGTVSSYLKRMYNLELDRSGKDVSRACFLCHDPEAWIHPLYLI